MCEFCPSDEVRCKSDSCTKYITPTRDGFCGLHCRLKQMDWLQAQIKKYELELHVIRSTPAA